MKVIIIRSLHNKFAHKRQLCNLIILRHLFLRCWHATIYPILNKQNIKFPPFCNTNKRKKLLLLLMYTLPIIVILAMIVWHRSCCLHPHISIYEYALLRWWCCCCCDDPMFKQGREEKKKFRRWKQTESFVNIEKPRASIISLDWKQILEST